MEFNQIKGVINQVYSLFNKRDIDPILTFMHPEVHWPNGWEGGYVEGHQGIRDYWTRQWKVLDPKVVPISIDQLEDGRIQVLVRQTVKDLEGKLIGDGEVRHIYTFHKGLIKTMEILPKN
ncbi:MAG: nuclear transport factor 2 family protein [Bacteroidota bacterium]